MAQSDLIEKAAEKIKELESELERVTSPPFGMVTVLKLLGDNRVLVSAGQGPVVMQLPDAKAEHPEIKKRLKLLAGLSPGDTVLAQVQSGALLERISVPLPGIEATVQRVFDGDQMEIAGGLGSGGAVVFKGLTEGCVKPGDRVQLDRTGAVAIRVMPKDVTGYSAEGAEKVRWEDVGGQEEAKRALREAVEGPIKLAKLWKAYGKQPLKGLLLFGPPGCGKTLLAKATANALRELHGGKATETGFIYMKGPEVLDKWVGNSEATVRGLFARAKEHREEHGYPAVMFIDEADAILGTRGSRHASSLSSTIVPTFLAEMDGMGISGAFVLLATNRQDTLDPAVVREGRIDRKVRIGRPQKKESAEILSIHLGRTKVRGKVGELAGRAAEEIFSDRHLLYQVALKGKGIKPFHMRELVSGAMLKGVVDAATSQAIERDAERMAATGVGLEDLLQAVEMIVQMSKGLNHEEALQAFADKEEAEIEAIQPMAA